MLSQNKIKKEMERSNKNKPIILLLHGFPFDHEMYRMVCEQISSVCDVIAPDFLGFGCQQATGQTSLRTMSDFADQLEEILQYLGIQQKIILCGLSMGGYIAMEFVRNYSSRLAGLILCDTKTIPDSPEAASNRIKLAETISAEKLPAIADQMILNLFCEKTRKESPETIEFLRNIILRQPLNGIAAASRGMTQRVDTTNLLKTLDCPILFICGEHDALSTPKSMLELKESVALANQSTFMEFVSVPDAGHLPPLEQPEAFAQIVLDFVKKITPSI